MGLLKGIFGRKNSIWDDLPDDIDLDDYYIPDEGELECPNCGEKLVHKGDFPDGFWECPDCHWSICDDEVTEPEDYEQLYKEQMKRLGLPED